MSAMFPVLATFLAGSIEGAGMVELLLSVPAVDRAPDNAPRQHPRRLRGTPAVNGWGRFAARRPTVPRY
jgi:hypothetical protein